MLRINYTPPDGESRLFEMPSLEDGIDTRESELIEDNGGRQWGTFMEWTFALTNGSMRASRVLLWVMLRRENPKLALDDLHFPLSALKVDETDDRPCRVCGNPEADAQHEGENSHKYEPPAESEGKDESGDSDTSSP